MTARKAYTDLTGQVFGRLTVLRVSEKQIGGGRWLCKCECGKEMDIKRSSLFNGHVKSCGCLKLDQKPNLIHGHRPKGPFSPEVKAWDAMKERCYNPKNANYHRYGGRGIFVCDEWRNSLSTFMEDMGKKPSKRHSLERVDNNKGYSKENCIWALPDIQHRNKRTNLWLEHNGTRMIITDWAKEFGVNRRTISQLLRSYDFSLICNYYSFKRKNGLKNRNINVLTYAKNSGFINQQ